MDNEEKQAFEKYPKLAKLLLHAGNNWKTDNTWSATLEQINIICKELTDIKINGFKCEVCGYDDPIKCLIDMDNEVTVEWLCGKHAQEAGYCSGCGEFCAGMTSYDFTHPGLCDNCYDQIRDDFGEDQDDEDYEDIHELPM